MLLVLCLSLALRAAVYLILGGVILEMVGQATHARWLYHPAVRLVVGVSRALCAPFRLLMRRMGIPTRPLDFSPMVAILALQLLHSLLVRL